MICVYTVLYTSEELEMMFPYSMASGTLNTVKHSYGKITSWVNHRSEQAMFTFATTDQDGQRICEACKGYSYCEACRKRIEGKETRSEGPKGWQVCCALLGIPWFW